jgi:hypothetical protein
MERGLEKGFSLGNTKGMYGGLGCGLQGGRLPNRSDMLNPTSIDDPKNKPTFYVNADNVGLVSAGVSGAYNLIDPRSTDIFTIVETVLTQTAGTTYRPPLVVNGLGSRNYMNFADTGNRYLETGTVTSPALFAQTSPSATATGYTFMFVIKRKQGGTYSILDARDSTSLSTPGDLLMEVNSSGAITFDYRGGVSGTVTSFIGTAGINLLNDWSVLTVKCQLRNDGGVIPGDNEESPISKRFAMPTAARTGNRSPLEIYVNGVEQFLTVTTNTFTNSDYFGDGTYRMLNRPIYIGNKGSVFGTSGTHIAAIVMFPCFLNNAIQQRVENYFKWYYSI